MDKAELKVLEITSQLDPAYVAEVVDMVGVKAWLLVPMEEGALLCVVVALSSSLYNLVKMLAPADKEMICQDGVAPLDITEIPPGTSKVIGEINLLKASLNKTNKAQWATSKVNKADSNQAIETAVP